MVLVTIPLSNLCPLFMVWYGMVRPVCIYGCILLYMVVYSVLFLVTYLTKSPWTFIFILPLFHFQLLLSWFFILHLHPFFPFFYPSFIHSSFFILHSSFFTLHPFYFLCFFQQCRSCFDSCWIYELNWHSKDSSCLVWFKKTGAQLTDSNQKTTCDSQLKCKIFNQQWVLTHWQPYELN